MRDIKKMYQENDDICMVEELSDDLGFVEKIKDKLTLTEYEYLHERFCYLDVILNEAYQKLDEDALEYRSDLEEKYKKEIANYKLEIKRLSIENTNSQLQAQYVQELLAINLAMGKEIAALKA
jgi:hypothetical protein